MIGNGSSVVYWSRSNERSCNRAYVRTIPSVTVVFPVPGPPVNRKMGDCNAVTMAFLCVASYAIPVSASTAANVFSISANSGSVAVASASASPFSCRPICHSASYNRFGKMRSPSAIRALSLASVTIACPTASGETATFLARSNKSSVWVTNDFSVT